MTGDTVFNKLLCYGLFPERLDGIFQSKDFGNWAIANESSINIPKKERYQLLNYKLTRNNNSPRYMGCPNPIGHVCLSQHIRKNWDKIEKRINRVPDYANVSMIRPKLDNKSKRLLSLDSYDKNPEEEQLHLTKQFGKKYYVKADISSCFPSIYTHTLSWALVGKTIAKKNQAKRKTWYNQLDQACGKIQDGETRGVPIGPDSSGILCEIILSQIDLKLKKYDYVRHIDDYACYCETKDEADKFIRDLSYELEQYRLQLNTKKTLILPLPQALNEDWVRKLKQGST